MSKGAVPIPYIIALLLGIAVVAILGYWFFVLSGLWGGEATLQTCRANAHTYCAGWQALGYTEDDDGNPSVGWFSDKYPACGSYNRALGFSEKDNADTDRDACESILAAT